MNWTSAGMLQGLGQGLAAAGVEASRAGVSATLQEQRDAMENKRAERNHEVQQKMQLETINAGKENLSSSQKHAEDMQGWALQHAEGQASDRRAFDERMQKGQFTHSEQLAQTAADAALKHSQDQINKMVEIARLQSDQAKAFHKDSTDLSMAAIRAQVNGVGQLQALADGTIMKVMKDGTSSLLTDSKGVPVKGLSDVTKTQQIIAEADRGLMYHYMTYLEKNDLTMSAQEKKEMQAKIESLSTSIHNTGKTPTAAVPGGEKTMSAEQYANNVAKKGKPATDAFVKANGITVAPSASPAPAAQGMLSTPPFAGVTPDNQYSQPLAPAGAPVPDYSRTPLKSY